MATKMIAAWRADLYTWVERDTAKVIAKCLTVNAGLEPRPLNLAFRLLHFHCRVEIECYYCTAKEDPIHICSADG